jgi:hypothetical protein
MAVVDHPSFIWKLVPFQGDIVVFSEFVRVHGKACLAGNGVPFAKGTTQFMSADKLTRRALP